MARTFASASSQYLHQGITISKPFTLACWFYDTVDTPNAMFSIGNAAGVDYDALIKRYNAGSGGRTIGAESYIGTIAAAYATTTRTANAWQHAVGVFAAADDRRCYLNGGSKGTEATSKAVTTNNLAIAALGDSSPSLYWDGSIAEAAVWNVALTDDEAAVLATGVSPLLVQPQSLVFYCPLIRDDDEDLVGGLSLTATNGPTVAAHPRVFYPGIAWPGLTAAVAGVPKQAMHYARLRRAA